MEKLLIAYRSEGVLYNPRNVHPNALPGFLASGHVVVTLDEDGELVVDEEASKIEEVEDDSEAEPAVVKKITKRKKKTAADTAPLDLDGGQE